MGISSLRIYTKYMQNFQSESIFSWFCLEIKLTFQGRANSSLSRDDNRSNRGWVCHSHLHPRLSSKLLYKHIEQTFQQTSTNSWNTFLTYVSKLLPRMIVQCKIMLSIDFTNYDICGIETSDRFINTYASLSLLRLLILVTLLKFPLC